jgi:hypothetical protein
MEEDQKEKLDNVLQNLESLMAKDSLEMSEGFSKENADELKQLLTDVAKLIREKEEPAETPPAPTPPPVVTKASSMKVRYEKAWKKVYNSKKPWRQREINEQLSTCGKLGEKSWDEEFAKEVRELAESDDPLND